METQTNEGAKLPIRSDDRMRLSDFAAFRQICINLARIHCRAGKRIKARKEGREWWVDFEATEKLTSILGGNAIELVNKSKGPRS